MAKKNKDNKIQYGSEEHLLAIERAYGLRSEVAKKVVEEFESGKKEWDVNYYERCKQMVALLDNPAPKAVSTRRGWKRDRTY